MVALLLCDTSLTYKHIESTDVDLYLFISNFVSNLTRGQRSLFGLILGMVQDNTKKMMNPIVIIKMIFIN